MSPKIKMKTIITLLLSLGIFQIVYSCSPASEKRDHMEIVANRTSDSILCLVDSAINDPHKTLTEDQKAQVTTTYNFEYR